MQNILVTGGSGFIGSNFIHYLFRESDFTGQVINVDSLTYAGNPYNLVDIEKHYGDRYQFMKLDICDQQSLDKVFKENSVDSIVHFAAESHVDRSILSPGSFIQTNIIGTFNLLELSKKYADTIKVFHHVSTDEVFGSLGSEGFFTESTSYKPNSPYSASKASSDHLVRAYNKTYNTPITISNCSNNYGPYQFPEKLIPLMILNALEGKNLPIYGDGLNIRDWLHVKDHCRAIWMIMNKGKIGQTYNVGGKNELTNIEVVKTVAKLLDQKSTPLDAIKSRLDLIKFVKDRPGHDHRYAIDCTKIENELGWQPAETFESGLNKTVDWYLENSSWVQSVQDNSYQEWVNTQYKERQ